MNVKSVSLLVICVISRLVHLLDIYRVNLIVFLSYSDLFYLLIVDVEGYFCTCSY